MCSLMENLKLVHCPSSYGVDIGAHGIAFSTEQQQQQQKKQVAAKDQILLYSYSDSDS